MFSRFIHMFFLAILLVFCGTNAYAGRVDLTTYYPAPYGEYTTLQTTSNAYFATTAGNVGIGTTNPQGPLDLGNGTSGRSLVWGGNGANWYDSIGASFSSAALSLVHGLKLRTAGADQYLYSYGTIDRAGIRIGNGAGDISFFNAASSAETVDNVFDYITNTKMIIRASGNVGVGTTVPAYRLDVNGYARASRLYGDLWTTGVAGNVNGGRLADRGGDNFFSVNWTGGALQFFIEDSNVATLNWSAPAKTFIIQHPLEQDKYLVHATLEGPENAVFYRGTAKLVSGSSEVILPSYFEALTDEKERTIILTNIDGFDRLAVKKQGGKKILNGKFTVVSDNVNSSQEFDWEVKAIRKDVKFLLVEPKKDQVEVKGFGPYKYYSIKSQKR